MSTTERDELAALLPPPPTEIDVPHAAGRRDLLLRELSRPAPARFRAWMPALAAASLVLVVALTAGVGLFLDRRSGGETAAPPGPDALSLSLERIETADRLNGTPLPYPAHAFVYIREITDTGTVGEHWYSVNGAKPDVLRVEGAATQQTWDPVPTGLTKVEELVTRPTLLRMRAARAAYTPAQLYAALSENATPAQVFRQIEQFLAVGGLADPSVRTWLYRTAALVDGAFFSENITVGGRDAAGISLTTGGVTRRILFDPANGTVSALGAAHEAPGDLDHLYLGYGPAPGSDKPPVSEEYSIESTEPPQTVRDFDFRNEAWEIPLDLGKRPQVRAATSGPVANFTDGVARMPKADEWPLQFSVKQILYLQPTPKQIGWADGPVPESAIVVVEIRPTDPGTDRGLSYTAVIGFAGTPGDLFPGPVTLVELVSGHEPVVVTTKADRVTLSGGKSLPRDYVRGGTGFVPAAR